MSFGVSIIIYLLITSLSGLTGLMPLVNAALTDLTPPIVRHKPPERISPVEKVVITAIVEDESNISSVNLWYRAAGKGTYTKIQMDRIDLKTYMVGIGATKDFKEGIEYYIEAVDQFGNEGTDGNKTLPYFVEIREIRDLPLSTEKTKNEVRIAKRTWWKNPWFWVGIVVAGGAVAAATGSSGGEGAKGSGTIIVE